jgi:Tol biopolymer transport system component
VAALVLSGQVRAAGAGRPAAPRARVDSAFVVTQLPAGADIEKHPPVSGGMLRAPYGDGARLVVISPGAPPRVLSGRFHSACDPEVSFDGSRILFAGKPTASEPWNIFEMAPDGSKVRQITRDLGNCRSPGYQSTLYTIVSPKPWYQITFVSDAAGAMNEYGGSPATDLYSCKLDGSSARRLTFNLSSDMDPSLMWDGRLLFAGWQRSTLAGG